MFGSGFQRDIDFGTSTIDRVFWRLLFRVNASILLLMGGAAPLQVAGIYTGPLRWLVAFTAMLGMVTLPIEDYGHPLEQASRRWLGEG